MKEAKVIICIPARLGSTRFHEKLLARKTGKSLIEHTWERACRASLPAEVIIAADDERIMAEAASFGARCVMTSKSHKSGTDRIAEAVSGLEADIIVNLQGDEPEIEPGHVDKVARLLTEHAEYSMSTLATSIKKAEQVVDPNVVKVVCDNKGKALYFSRAPIPYDREAGGPGKSCNYLRHLGIYAYRRDFLMRITQQEQSKYEKIEKLEQLRVLENGYSIIVGEVEDYNEGIDTAEQYEAFAAKYNSRVKD